MESLFNRLINKEETCFQKHNLSSLEEMIEFIENSTLPTNYQKIEFNLSNPTTLTYIDDKSFLDVSEDNIDENKVQKMGEYHFSMGDFSCEIQDDSIKDKILIFGNNLIKTHFNLKPEDSLIIPEPIVYLTSQDRIGFLVLYDYRTYTPENLSKLKSKGFF